MIKSRLLVIALVALISLTNCYDYLLAGRISGSGEIITVKKDFDDFNAIEVSHSFDIKITQSKSYSVEIKIDDNLEEYLNVEKHGNTLKIYLDYAKSYRNIELEATITLPDIRNVELSGACNADIQGFNFRHSMEIELSGASSIQGEIETGDLSLDLSGASNVKLEGSGDDLHIQCSGASNAKLGDYPADDANIGLSGASSVRVNLSGELNADLSGASSIRYYGNPQMGEISTSGASSIHSM